ncbi:hypothetical protein DPMN_184487 [Dreissena polymorpha]|uniref:Uncharacterized protein n=1 Tax=Dreissena polymorpha TaxID=45954 RepID=A0A9D4DJN4_DREPO|nr:hypothetical protein DPMN_184487 [Dreissena polymorpha]
MSKKVSEHELSDSSPTAAGKYAANLAGHGVPLVPYETASRGRLPRPRPREMVRKARDAGGPLVPYETASRGRLPRPRPRETVRKAWDTGSR